MNSLKDLQCDQKVFLVCFNSYIIFLDKSKAAFLIICNKVKEKAKDFIADLLNKPLKFINNSVFIKKSFESDSKKSKNDKNIIISLNKNYKKSHVANTKKKLSKLISYKTRF